MKLSKTLLSGASSVAFQNAYICAHRIREGKPLVGKQDLPFRLPHATKDSDGKSAGHNEAPTSDAARAAISAAND